MNAAFPALPGITCRYEHYDPETLKPTNVSTYVRLIETGWTAETFKGKSVLDIGCNSGLLSLFAHDLGAGSVHSVDVQVPFIDFFSEVVRRHNLPIKVEKAGFLQLEPGTHAADVVLFMEVLHWIVHQGGTIPDAIGRLAALTRETLLIETPWDVSEPSIATKAGYPVENYDIELIFRELARHFETVRVERFMTYFGDMPGSKRVLITATGRRTASLPIRHILDANHTGISLSRGTNPMVLVSTTLGPKTLKTVPENSAFVRLDDAQVERLGDFLNSQPRTSPLVAPERLGRSYRQREADGRAYMLFPFVGHLGDYFPEVRPPQPVSDPMELALGVFGHLSQAPRALIEPLRDLFGRLPAFNFRDLPAPYAQRLQDEGLAEFLDSVAQRLTGYEAALEDALIHNDMQTGNMVPSPDGRGRVVDLDLVRAGPAYADIFSCAIHTGADAETLTCILQTARKAVRRAPARFDLAFSVGSSLLWLRTILQIRGEIAERVADRYVGALTTMRDMEL